MKVSTVAQMRELDRRAGDEYGIPGHILMETAGHAVYEAIRIELGLAGQRVLVLCGPGHNGGDGLVAARKLNSSGASVQVMVLADPARYGDAPVMYYGMLSRAGVAISVRPEPAQVAEALLSCDAVVDALLGTGVDRELSGQLLEVVELVNAADVPVFAVDIPTGVNGDTGQVQGEAVVADVTVTFGLPKLGNLLYPGAELCGTLYVSHISFPPALQDSAAIQVALSRPPQLPPRRTDGHKGSFGDVLFVAGAASYYGAPTLAALSLLKAGGGYSRLAAPRSVIPTAATLAPELVFAPQPETGDGALALAALPGLRELAAGVDFVVLGPGLSLDGEAQQVARQLATRLELPLLLDGDGLTAVASEPGAIRARTAPTVLTPHPGEMARLCTTSVGQIKQSPVEHLQRLCADLGATVVLKGAHSLIGAPDGRVWINTSGNSGMGTAGSGDVLTGTIAAMFGLGLELEQAVLAGVFVHGLAGDLAAGAVGADGITARDVLEHLPAAVRTYREQHDQLLADHYGAVRVL